MILRSHDPKVTWSDQVDDRFRIIGHGYSDQMSRTVAENRVLKRDIYIYTMVCAFAFVGKI